MLIRFCEVLQRPSDCKVVQAIVFEVIGGNPKDWAHLFGFFIVKNEQEKGEQYRLDN